MGLFSNNKKPCPICGNATPRLLPTKVEGVPICKECDKKIDLPNGVLDSMTLDDFRRYIDFYNKNQVLRERFHPEYRFGFGAFNTQLVLDVTNGLFRLKDDESTIVFEKSALKSFRITEDKEPLFTGTVAGLVCAESKNPERVRLLAPRIEQFKLQRSDYERIMQAERVQYLDRTNEEWRERERELEFHKPEFRESSPFRQFVVELELDHPYWKAYRNELDAPEFDDDYPSVDSFLHKYDEKVNEPLFADDVDFETFSKSDFRVVKIEACEAVPKSKKLLKFTLNDGTDRKRTILSGIHEYYEPEELVGKTCVAITNLPPRKMMGIDSEGMLISAVYEYDGREGLNLLMLDDSIPAGAKLY